MAYQKQIWENLPSTNTPLSADRLNHMEDGIYEAYEHGVALENVANKILVILEYTKTTD